MKLKCQIPLASTGVDIIWADDLRVELQMSAKFVCFCDDCIKRFNKLNGSHYDRSSLVDEVLNNIDLRRRYTGFIRKSLYEFVSVISKAAHSVNPNIRLVYQSVYFTNMIGQDLNCILDAMRDKYNPPSNKSVMIVDATCVPSQII